MVLHALCVNGLLKTIIDSFFRLLNPVATLRTVTVSKISTLDRVANLPEFLVDALSRRGIAESEALSHQLTRLPSPSLMKGLADAVDYLIKARRIDANILIVGDFDADGATSTALLMKALPRLGFQQVNFFVPDRFTLGYGLSVAAVEALAYQKPDLIITVDNGISSIEGIAKANALGIGVIVTDHHLPGETLPDAKAIVNPSQPECEFPTKSLAGVGVAFYLLIALRKQLIEDGELTPKTAPNLAQYLDLVALGTVADLVPLEHTNRVLVAQGIKRIRAGKMSEGIRALLQVARKPHEQLTSSDLGFALGPRLNAAGRLDDMSQGIMLLTTDSPDFALDLATELDELNQARKNLQSSMEDQAKTLVDALEADVESLPRGLCLFQESWHQGVVGLVASKMKERCNRPVFAFAREDDDSAVLKGSGRSVQGVHLRDLLDRVATENSGLIDKFGGHAMAAGLSLHQDKLADFESAINKALGECEAQLFSKTVFSDGELAEENHHLYHAELIRDLLPWGQGVPEPQFHGTFNVFSSKVVGEKHLKLVLYKEDPNQLMDAIWFFYDPAEDVSTSLNVVYKLQVNHFRGNNSLQLHIEAVLDNDYKVIHE